eukprot:c19075_g1_i1 orf=243-1802(-)
MLPGEKRGLTKDHAYQNEGKKPRHFPSEVLSALRNDLREGLTNNFETFIRPIVAEEIDRAISKAAAELRAPLNQITESPARELYLHFTTNPKAEYFTESKLEGEHGDTIRVSLMNASTAVPVTTGPESEAKLEVVPLAGDFNTPHEKVWTAEEFEKNVAKGRKDKGSLLVGDLKVALKGGVGTLKEMRFTDNSSFTKSKKFRLGVRVAQDNGGGLACIREGISKAFSVKDIRGKGYMKHDNPSPSDPVWRLKGIRKRGPYHLKLMQNDIRTVGDILAYKQTKPELLEKMLGKMSGKQYQEAMDHAEKCVLGGTMYVYQTPNRTLIFNQNYQTVGAVAEGHYVGLDAVDDVKKVDSLVKDAYDHWDTNVTQCTIEDSISMEEQFIMPAAESVDALPADVLHGMQFTAIQESNDYLDGNAMAAWTSQEQGSGFDYGCSSQNLNFQPFYTDLFGLSDVADQETINSYVIAKAVKDVMKENEEDPSVYLMPTENRWWLRIRTVVRCALFIRKARSDWQQQLEN